MTHKPAVPYSPCLGSGRHAQVGDLLVKRLKGTRTKRKLHEPPSPPRQRQTIMSKGTSHIRRSVAAITLPLVLSACMSWQHQELPTLREVITQEQPDEIRIHTRVTGRQLDVTTPRVSGDTISGSSDGREVNIPLALVTEASVRKVDKANTTLMVLGIAGLVGLAAALASYETPKTIFEWTGWCFFLC